MKKVILIASLFMAICLKANADPIASGIPQNPNTTPPLSSVTSQFSTVFLDHISAVDSFRSDGSHVIKFSDGIFQAVPYKGDHLLVGSFGLIPNPQDSTSFFKSYSVHLHLLSIMGKYLDINPSYSDILNQLELTPAFTYDTDVKHGLFDFSVGYAHKFGGSPQS